MSVDLSMIFFITSGHVLQGPVFLCWTSTKARINVLAQGHKAVMPVRLEPAAPQSSVKHSTSEPLRSLFNQRKKPPSADLRRSVVVAGGSILTKIWQLPYNAWHVRSIALPLMWQYYWQSLLAGILSHSLPRQPPICHWPPRVPPW